MKPLSPSLKVLSGETQRIGRRPLAIAAARRAFNAGLAFVDRLIFGDTVSRLLADSSAADEWAACLEEGRRLPTDTGALIAALRAQAKALEAQLQVVPGQMAG